MPNNFLMEMSGLALRVELFFEGANNYRNPQNFSV